MKMEIPKHIHTICFRNISVETPIDVFALAQRQQFRSISFQLLRLESVFSAQLQVKNILIQLVGCSHRY